MSRIASSLVFLLVLSFPLSISKVSFARFVWRETPKEMTWDDHKHILRQLSSDVYLKKLAFLESSYGRLNRHRTVVRGIHSGTSAVGFWGIMPLTAKDLILRYSRLRQKYGHLIDENTPLNRISYMILSNPELHKDLVLFYRELIYKAIECEKRRVYAWKYGINGAMMADAYAVENDPYVVRFFSLNHRDIK